MCSYNYVLFGKFGEIELKIFLIRYDNEHDIKSDERYNAWLRRYHPKEKMRSLKR